jgi:hypothetical protein
MTMRSGVKLTALALFAVCLISSGSARADTNRSMTRYTDIAWRDALIMAPTHPSSARRTNCTSKQAPDGTFLPSTQALDPGATGFHVYEAMLGTDPKTLAQEGTAPACRPWAVAVRLLRSGNGSWKMHKPAYSLIANRSPLSGANWNIEPDIAE